MCHLVTLNIQVVSVFIFLVITQHSLLGLTLISTSKGVVGPKPVNNSCSYFVALPVVVLYKWEKLMYVKNNGGRHFLQEPNAAISFTWMDPFNYCFYSITFYFQLMLTFCIWLHTYCIFCSLPEWLVSAVCKYSRSPMNALYIQVWVAWGDHIYYVFLFKNTKL